jgi:hypothetical protein
MIPMLSFQYLMILNGSGSLSPQAVACKTRCAVEPGKPQSLQRNVQRRQYEVAPIRTPQFYAFFNLF